MRSEGNAPKNGEPTVGFPFTITPQHTVRFWERISWQITMWQHCNNPPILLTWHQLIFSCSLVWNQLWMEGAFVMLLTSVIMRRKSWKGFQQMASRNVSNSFTVAGTSAQLHKGKCILNDGIVLYFSDINSSREHFEATTHMMLKV